GWFDVSQVLCAVDDPILFVAAGEVENLLVLRQDNERGVAELGLDLHDIRRAVANGSRARLGVFRGCIRFWLFPSRDITRRDRSAFCVCALARNQGMA